MGAEEEKDEVRRQSVESKSEEGRPKLEAEDPRFTVNRIRDVALEASS